MGALAGKLIGSLHFGLVEFSLSACWLGGRKSRVGLSLREKQVDPRPSVRSFSNNVWTFARWHSSLRSKVPAPLTFARGHNQNDDNDDDDDDRRASLVYRGACVSSRCSYRSVQATRAGANNRFRVTVRLEPPTRARLFNQSHTNSGDINSSLWARSQRSSKTNETLNWRRARSRSTSESMTMTPS